MARDVKWYGPRMEIARGIAIILVTIGHSEPIKETLPAVKDIIYTFHMPLFFFMSGFFSVKLKNLSLLHYAAPSVMRLAIPYITVSCSYFTIKYLVPQLVQRPVYPLRFIVDLALYPANNPALFLWFLYVIIIFKLLVSILRFIPTWLMLCAASFAALFTSTQEPLLGMNYIVRYAIFFMAGLWVYQVREQFLLFLASKKAPLAFMLGFGMLYCLHLTFHMENKIVDVLLAFTGTFMVLSICFSCYDCVRYRLLSFAGKHSLEIYLLQYYFIFPVLYLMRWIGVEPVMIIPFTFIAGLVGPLAVIRYLLPLCTPAKVLLGMRQ